MEAQYEFHKNAAVIFKKMLPTLKKQVGELYENKIFHFEFFSNNFRSTEMLFYGTIQNLSISVHRHQKLIVYNETRGARLLSVIIYVNNLLNSDRSRAVQLLSNSVRKCVIPCRNL